MNVSRIGSSIKGMRTAKGMTPKQLAKSVGVSEGFIIELESGRKIANDELIKKLFRVLGREQDADFEAETGIKGEEDKSKKPLNVSQKEIQKVWDDAFGSVLKSVPIYEYDLERVIDSRQMPVVSNRIEGYPKDKVLYLRIMDNSMAGFRIVKGDVAFAHLTGEIESNSVCLIVYKGERVVRQIKRLDGDRLLLVGNSGSIVTDMVSIKDIKVLARLVKVEIKL